MQHIGERGAAGVVERIDNAPETGWERASQVAFAAFETAPHVSQLHHVARGRDPHRQRDLFTPRLEPGIRQREVARWPRRGSRPASITEHEPRDLLVVTGGDGLTQFAIGVVAHSVELRRQALSAIHARRHIAVTVGAAGDGRRG